LCVQPPYGDIDDRIRAISKGLGLRTIIWTYDTNDWEEGTDNVTAADIDANYQVVIDSMNNGTFKSVRSATPSPFRLLAFTHDALQQGTIVLTHEIDNFTMQEAIKMYPLLNASFKVSFDHRSELRPVTVLNMTLAFGPCRRRPQYYPTLRGNELYTGHICGM
jgi:hypothetical protein